jgi:hypothetical protein
VTPERSLSSALVFISDDLERRGYAFSGAVRRAARALVEFEAKSKDSDKPCPQCGAEVRRAARGRPAIYCSARCRHRARYSA